MDSRAGTVGPQPALELVAMPQQSEAFDSTENWTGIINIVRRRKLQNRLSQRAMRRRKLKQRFDSFPGELLPPIQKHLEDEVFLRLRHEGGSDELQENRQASGRKKSGWMCRLATPEAQAALRCFAQQATTEFMSGTLRLIHLPMLIQFNVFTALLQNATAAGMSDEWLSDDAISPFNREGPGLHTMPPSCPTSLLPSPTQVRVHHHPWLDLFPLPRLRDNILLQADTQSIDIDELCVDIMDVCDPNNTSEEKPTLIAWGEPWDARNWEASVHFLRKWGCVMEGCHDLMLSTNYWRGQRGERKLILQT